MNEEYGSRRLKVVYDDDLYQGMRRKIHDWSRKSGRRHKYLEYILLAPDFLHLMVKLSADRRVPARCKVQLGVAIAYFLSPLDLLPEAVLGPIGYLDDIAVAAWVLDDLIKTAGPEVVLEHWAGEADVIDQVARITGGMNEMIGAGMVRRIKKMFHDQGINPPALNGRSQKRLN